MKLLFFDLETTGINFEKCAIIQLGAIAVDLNVDGKLKLLGAIDLKMRPRPGKMIDQRALEVNEFSLDEIMTWQEDHEAHEKFMKFISKFIDKYDKLDKFKLVGYNNSHFDTDFLRQWFNDNNEKYFGSYFWIDQIDVMCEASRYLVYYRPIMNNFKLGNVASVLGIPLDESELHDGMYDIKITFKVFKKMLDSGNFFMPFSNDTAEKIFMHQQETKEKFSKRKSAFTEETAWIVAK